jgi:putative ABC transport system permease protein
LVIGDGSTSADQLAAHISELISADRATVQTSADYAEQKVQDLAQGADIFGYLLLIFGVIALLVGAILIVNTFLILLAQRRRQVGLLRAVGASGSQVRRSMLVEAVLIGVIGAALGIGLGIGVAAVAAGISGSISYGLVVPPTVLGAAAVGLAVTVLAALLPAGRATRVSPLEALRPVAHEQAARRSSVVVGVVAVLLAGVGGTLIGYGLATDTQPLLLSVAGSLLVATGVLIGARLYFPLLLRAIGLLARPISPVARLATDNAARNPGRAAATGAALMLAVGLIVTLQVGAASVRESTNVALDAHYPVDITVSDYEHPLQPEVADRVAAIPGVVDTAVLKQAQLKLDVGEEPIEMAAVAGVDVGSAVSEGAGAITGKQLLIDPFLADSWDIAAGQQVTVRNGSRELTLTAVPHRLGTTGPLVVTPDVLSRLAPDAPESVLWARAEEAADVVKINSQLTTMTEDNPELSVGGALSIKATYATLLAALLAIATALLGVAAVIALIGIGNTLGLSVIERTRESALLRALGLGRVQLRMMILVEAVLLSIGGAAVGIVAGIFFGLVGTHALSLSTELNFPRVVLTVSPWQTATVVLVAIIAGVLASIVPGRRAAAAAPVEALAET